MGGQPGRAAPRSLTGEPGGWPPGTVPEKETDERAKVLLRVAELHKERTDGLVALITSRAPGRRNTAAAAAADWSYAAAGSPPGRSPPSREPAPSIVPPAASPAARRLPDTRWLARARASQPAQGVGGVIAGLPEVVVLRRRRSCPTHRACRGLACPDR